MAKVRKILNAASKKIDELLTPSELTKAQAAARKRTGRKIAKDKDPLKAFEGSKDPAVKKLRAEKAAEAKARASKTRAGQRKRQAAARKEAVDKRKSQIAKGAGSTAGATALVGAGTAASRSAQPSKPQSSKPQSSKTQSPRKGTPESKVMVRGSSATMLKDAGVGKARTIAEAKDKGLSTFIDKSGKRKAAVTKEELEKSGMTLREYLNKQKADAKKKAGGGMMKSKMASKGGAKGGRKPKGMKAGGSLEMTMVGGRKVPAFAADGKGSNDLAKKAMGGMMKSKGMAKGGAMKKKGYAMGGMTKKGMAKGGAVRRNTKPRGVGAALRGYGKAMK